MLIKTDRTNDRNIHLYGLINDLGKKMKNNKIVENASWLIICRIIQAALSFIIGTISARYLGPDNYGLINYATAVATFLVPIVQLGIRHVLVQELINNPKDEGEILGTSLTITSIVSLFGMIGMTLFSWLVNHGSTEAIVVCALYSLTLLFQSLEMIQYWFQAKLLSKYVAITSLIAYVLVSTYRIILLIFNKSVYWFALSHAIDYFLIACILLILYKKKSTQKFRFSFKRVKLILAKSRYYIVSGVMVSLFSQVDRIMLTIMCGEWTNGIYAAAYTCSSVSGFVFLAIIDSFRPLIFETKKKDSLKAEKSISKLYSIVIYMAIIQGVILSTIAPVVIRVLYGIEYIDAVKVLRILVWCPLFSYMGTIRNIWILAENKQDIMWVINTCGLVMNILGNYIMIPIMGATGAAIASVFTQMFTNLLLCLFIKKIRYNLTLIWNGLNPKVIMKMLLKVFNT